MPAKSAFSSMYRLYGIFGAFELSDQGSSGSNMVQVERGERPLQAQDRGGGGCFKIKKRPEAQWGEDGL